MEITYTISRDDYWQFRWFYILHRQAHRRTLVLDFLAGTLLAAAIAWRLDASTMVIVISAPLIGALFLVAALQVKRKLVMDLPREGGDILGERFLRVDADGVVERTKTRHTLTQWSGILDVAVNRNYIFIFVDTDHAVIVPKRAFQKPPDAQAFVDEAMAHSKASKVKPTAVDRYGYPVNR